MPSMFIPLTTKLLKSLPRDKLFWVRSDLTNNVYKAKHGNSTNGFYVYSPTFQAWFEYKDFYNWEYAQPIPNERKEKKMSAVSKPIAKPAAPLSDSDKLAALLKAGTEWADLWWAKPGAEPQMKITNHLFKLIRQFSEDAKQAAPEPLNSADWLTFVPNLRSNTIGHWLAVLHPEYFHLGNEFGKWMANLSIPKIWVEASPAEKKLGIKRVRCYDNETLKREWYTFLATQPGHNKHKVR